jgi:hypothetical protein
MLNNEHGRIRKLRELKWERVIFFLLGISLTLKILSSETLVKFYFIAQRQIPEVTTLYSHCCEDLESNECKYNSNIQYMFYKGEVVPVLK